MTGIKWCDRTWNCVHGCNMFTPGCWGCYALKITFELEHGNPKKPNAKRPFAGMGLTYVRPDGKIDWTGKVVLSPHRLGEPFKWKKPSLIFGNSMYDLFHEEMPLEWIQEIFDVCRRAHWHQFMFLTKRSKKMLDLDPQIDWPGNVQMGVSIESDQFVNRADHLRGTGAAVKFLSVEPLIGAVPSLSTEGIDQVIVGGESGPDFRPMKMEWVEEILQKCRATGTAFFGKQDASLGDGTKGRFKDRPDLWIQEFPMPGSNAQLRKFYRETEGRAKGMRVHADVQDVLDKLSE